MSDCPIKIRITTKRDQGQQVETGRANDLDDVEYDGGDDHAVEFEAAVGEDVEQTAAATVLRQNTHRARVDARTDERVQIVVTHLANLQAAFHDDTLHTEKLSSHDVHAFPTQILPPETHCLTTFAPWTILSDSENC